MNAFDVFNSQPLAIWQPQLRRKTLLNIVRRQFQWPKIIGQVIEKKLVHFNSLGRFLVNGRNDRYRNGNGKNILPLGYIRLPVIYRMFPFILEREIS